MACLIDDERCSWYSGEGNFFKACQEKQEKVLQGSGLTSVVKHTSSTPECEANGINAVAYNHTQNTVFMVYKSLHSLVSDEQMCTNLYIGLEIHMRVYRIVHGLGNSHEHVQTCTWAWETHMRVYRLVHHLYMLKSA